MVSTCLEKPTYAPTQLSEVPPALPVKQFQCASEWWWPSLVHWPPSPQHHCHYVLAKQLWQCGRECQASSPPSTSNTSAHPTLEPVTKGCTTTSSTTSATRHPWTVIHTERQVSPCYRWRWERAGWRRQWRRECWDSQPLSAALTKHPSASPCACRSWTSALPAPAQVNSKLS